MTSKLTIIYLPTKPMDIPDDWKIWTRHHYDYVCGYCAACDFIGISEDEAIYMEFRKAIYAYWSEHIIKKAVINDI